MIPANVASPMIKALLSAAAYTHPVGRIELLETHISWIILTGQFAYKIKKPVDLGFLDFTDLGMRHHYCKEELRLNRAWAPRVYLDVVAVVDDDGQIKVGGNGTPIEYALRMRQFDQAMRLDHLIETGRLTRQDVLELAEEIASRHGEAPRIPASAQLLDTTRRLIWDNFRDLRDEVPPAFLDRLQDWMTSRLVVHEDLVRQRIDTGFFRECHGDLHLANIVRLPEGIRAFDCIEFSAELREIDVVADYAFLTMDFIARGAVGFAYTFVNRYLEKTGDYQGARLLPIYLLYRAMVRAKIAAIGHEQRKTRTDRAEDRHTLDRYCALARALVANRRPVLLLMHGLSGSGKTWLSTQLVPLLPALRLRSDLERKRRFKVREDAKSRSGIAAGIYAADVSTAVYEDLMNAAGHLLDAGINVIIDAAFLDARNRWRARSVAAARNVTCVTVSTVAGQATLRDRVRRRHGAGDASEADTEVLEYQLESADPLTADEMNTAVIVDTEDGLDAAELAARLRALRY